MQTCQSGYHVKYEPTGQATYFMPKNLKILIIKPKIFPRQSWLISPSGHCSIALSAVLLKFWRVLCNWQGQTIGSAEVATEPHGINLCHC